MLFKFLLYICRVWMEERLILPDRQTFFIKRRKRYPLHPKKRKSPKFRTYKDGTVWCFRCCMYLHPCKRVQTYITAWGVYSVHFIGSGVWRCHVFLMSSIEFLTLFLINGSPLPQGNRCRRITSTDCGIQIQRHLYRKAHTAESWRTRHQLCGVRPADTLRTHFSLPYLQQQKHWCGASFAHFRGSSIQFHRRSVSPEIEVHRRKCTLHRDSL